MKIKICCNPSGRKASEEINESQLKAEEYTIEEEYKVAHFNPDVVKCKRSKMFTNADIAKRTLFKSMVHRQTFKSAIFGVTWKPILVFLILYFCFQIPYQFGAMKSKNCPSTTTTTSTTQF